MLFVKDDINRKEDYYCYFIIIIIREWLTANKLETFLESIMKLGIIIIIIIVVAVVVVVVVVLLYYHLLLFSL